MLSAMPQGRDGQAPTGSGLSLFHSAGGNLQSPCKNLLPLKAIKGEPGLTIVTGSQGSQGSPHSLA